jgi:predicted RNA binding protein YcfA (HicA-like mRNA interferase family)
VGRTAKIWRQVLGGGRNVRFDDLVKLAQAFGFDLRRVSGSHHILLHARAGRLLNLQPGKDGMAKPYQIRQFLDIVEECGLSMEDQE